MRRVATELGTGAASLYRYVDNREDLLDLMIDATGAEYVFAAPTGDWLADLLDIGDQARAIMRRHPWLPSLLITRSVLGPNGLVLLEHVLKALAAHPASLAAKLEAFAILSTTTALFVQNELGGGSARQQRNAAYLNHALATGRYPQLAELLATASAAQVSPAAEPADRYRDIVARILSGLLVPLARGMASCELRATVALREASGRGYRSPECRFQRVLACCAPGEREDHGDVNASVPVSADRFADKCLVPDHVDGVDHLVGYGGQGAGPVARAVGGLDGLDGIAVAGPGEAAGVGIDDGVGEKVVSGPGRGSLPVADADVDVGVDPRVPPAPDLLYAPGDVAGRQVVEEHSVGLGACEAEHTLAEGAEDDLGPAIAELDAEAKFTHLIVVTSKGDGVAGQALAQQRDEFAHVGQWAGRVAGAVPIAGHYWRGDADTE
jgi:AcrR family transcriptional regulator